MRVESRARRVAKVHAAFAACRLFSLRPAFRRYLLQRSGESAARMNGSRHPPLRAPPPLGETKKPEERMFLPVSILSSAQFGLVAVRRRRT